MWAVGTDGVAYRWDPFLKKWFAYGRRKDFKRIDGAEDGSALAVTDKGDLYYTNGKAAGLTKWVKVGTRVSDVGLGGGVAWIAKTGEGGDDGQVWTAPNSGNGVFKWSQWSGGMVRIDVGPDGNAWGVNERDEVFQFVGGNWKQYAAKAKDIGVGSEGTVWIVGTDIVNNRGGGTLYRRDTRTGRWIKDTRRLRDVTAGPADQPAGVSSTNQIWDKTARAVTVGNQGSTDSGPTDGPGDGGAAGPQKPDPGMRRRVVTKHSGNWFRLPGAALDLGLGHKGHIWAVGSDRFAYRWDTGKKSWVRHGNRQDLMHIDAAPDGGAMAVATSGEVYFTSSTRTGRDRWTKVGGKASDVGIGGGWAWITGADQNSGGGQVWRARYDGSGRFSWRRVRGGLLSGLSHIDADPNGNAWGVNDKNEIYRFDGQKWKKIAGEAVDIGIGADNSVWIAGGDIVEQKGGGTLAQYDARIRKWIKEGKRLRSVTSGIGGNPAGTSHGNEIWIRNFGDTPQGKGTNLALGKKTSQSPQLRLRGHAARAVDGKTNGNFSNGSVTDIRSGDTPPWLMVDLGAVYRIDSLRVYNRTDCCGARLNGAIVETSNTGEWKETDTTFAATISDARQSIDFEVAKTGRYVRVRHIARQVLGIAEIEVFGGRERVTPEPVKIARENITIRLSDDWTKLAGQALDMGVGSGGHMWVIGTDKFAYRWDAAKNEWVRHGKRRDFLRIDTAADGGAMAVSSSGGLFHTPGGSTDNAKWTQVGGKTRDVGIGGGWVWITSTTKTGGGGLTARARYDASGKFSWQRATRGLVHVDAGEDGNAWGVDDQGDIYQLVGGNWRRHGGRKAADIGVGGDNTVWIVDADADDTTGGGTLHRLDPGGGGWVSENARLKTVTAGPQGQPAGINSANEIWARDFSGGAAPVAVAGGATQKPKGKTAKITDVAGARAGLPEGLKDVVLEQVKAENGFTTGKVMLNGNPAVVVTYTPKGKAAPNVIIWHKRFKFSDYMPDAGGTPLDKIGTLNNTAFAIIPKANENTTLPPAVVAYLDSLRGGEGKPFPGNRSLKAGVNLVAGFDTAQMPGIKQFTAIFGRKPRNFLLAGTVDGSIFKNVKQTPVKPAPSRNPADMAKLVQVYGQTFLKNLVLEGEKLPQFKAGPLTYTDAKYEVSGEAGAIQVGFEVSMEMEAKPLKEGSSAASTVTFDAIRVDYDQAENTVTLTGEVAAEETKNFVSYRDIEVEKLSFEGVKPEGEKLTLNINGSGKIGPEAVLFEITLEEKNKKYEAQLKIKGELTLAEILRHVFKKGAPPGSKEIALEEATFGPGYQAGVASLAGENVTFASFQPKNQKTMVAIEHRALQLANYLPQLADTPVKKLGLGRSVFIIVGDLKNPNGKDLIGPTLKIEKADVENTSDPLLPSFIVKMLKDLEAEATRKTFGKSIYPLTLRANGITMVALYTTDENQVSADADSQKVIDSLGITHDTYILKGFVNKDMIRAVRYAKKNAGSGGGSTLAKAVLPLLEGLDIGFPVPAFQPPKSKGLITFSDSRFRLKGVDGKLETFVSSGMSAALPASGKTAVKAMDMVGKVKPVYDGDELEVEFAATTQLNGTEADETPFARLKALNDPDAEDAVSALVPTSEPSQGWKPAFGVPFLTVEQFSVGGSFTGSGATGPVQVNVGMQTIVADQTPGQRLVLKGDFQVTDNKITDMVLEIPGSVKIAALPGINDIPGVNALTFSDVKLSRYELAGQVSGRGATLSGVLSRDPDSSDYALYLAATDTNLGVFSQSLSRKIPSTFGDFPIQRGVMVGSNMATQPNVTVEDLPERAQAMFAGIVEDDAEITIARGVSVFTRLEPEKLPESNRIRKLLVNDFGFTAPLLFAGAIEVSSGSATPKVWLAASVPNYKIPGVSEDILKFEGTKMFLEDISGVLTGSVEGEMAFNVKGKQFRLEDGKVGAAVDGKDKEMVVTGAYTKTWEKAFGIPFLTLDRLELDVNVKTSDAGPDVDWGIKTQSVLNKASPDEQAFDANGKLEVEENVVTDIVLELPGTVDIKKLPAIGKVPVINQLSYSDVKLSIYEIAANVLWTGTDKEVAGVFVRDRDKPDEVKYTLYGAIQNAKIGNLVGLFSKQAANKIPGALEDFPINTGVVVVSNQPKATPTISELPERAQPLFAGYFTQQPDKQLNIVNGVSVYTTIDRNNTRKDDPVWKLLFGEKSFNLKEPVTFEGSIIKNQPDPAKVRLAASIPTYKIPGIPENILKFDNSEVVFSNEDGKETAIVGEMTFKGPDKQRKLDGSVTYAGSDGNKEVKIKGASKGDWDKALGIPGLTLSNPVLHVNAKRGTESSTGLGIESEAVFSNQKVSAKGELAMADGRLAGAAFTLVGTVDMKTVPGIEKIPGLSEFTFTDVVLSRNLIADSNLIAGKTAWDRIGKDKKLDAAFIEKDGTYALLIKVDSFSVGQLSSNVPNPVAGITIPNGVIALSNQDFESFNVDELPEPVRKSMFDDIVGERTGQKIKISEGVTVLAKVDPNNQKILPPPISPLMTKMFQIKQPVIVAGTIGGVFGGPGSAALYAQIPNAVIPGGAVLKKMLNFRDVAFFVRADANAVSQIGFGGAMDFKVPHLDDPKKMDTLDLAGELYADLGTAAPSLEVAGKMTGRWPNPMGLNDFTFEDTEIKVGVNADGSVDIGLGGQAEFKSRKEGLVYYATDLLLGLTPAVVPNKLAVQFVAKKKQGDNLVNGASINHLTMVEMTDSLFRGVLTGGGSDQMISRIQPASARSAAKKLQGLLGKNSLLDVMQLDKIPLSLLSVRDPLVYFSTPGASLPPREGIPAPTLGLGVILTGDLQFKLLGTTTDLADADMRLTINDGLKVKARFPRRELGPVHAAGELDVQAGLVNLGNASFMARGDAGIKDFGLPLPGANASYELSMKQDGLAVKMDGSASVVGLKRKVGLAIAPTSMDFNSPGDCTSPFDISAKATYSDFKSFNLSGLTPKVVPLSPTDLTKCDPLELARMAAVVAKPAIEAGKAVGKAAAQGSIQSAEAAVKLARGDLKGAAVSAAKAAKSMKAAADYVSGAKVFRAGLSSARKAWAASIGKVPGLGPALGQFADALGGAASEVGGVFEDFGGAAKEFGNAMNPVKHIPAPPPPTEWFSFSERAQVTAAESELLKTIKADPNFQKAPQSQKDQIIQDTLALETQLRQERNDLIVASRERMALEKKRLVEFNARKVLKQKLAEVARLHSQGSGSKNASHCPHGQFWNMELGRCWQDGYALLKTNWRLNGDRTLKEEVLPYCMAADGNGELWKDWCETDPNAPNRTDRDVAFKIGKDGTIQTSDGRCLGLDEKAGNSANFPQVLALKCSGADTQKWKFDTKGRFVAGNGLCITQVDASTLRGTGLKSDVLRLADCDKLAREKPYDWTPDFGSPDYRARAERPFPDTLMLKYSGGGTCIHGGIPYNAQPSFDKCETNNAHQMFAVSFVDDRHFVFASRTAHTCLDASPIEEGLGNKIVSTACLNSESQQFSIRDAGYTMRFVNRKTGLCLTVTEKNYWRPGAPLIQQPCEGEPAQWKINRRQWLRVIAVDKIPPFTPPPKQQNNQQTSNVEIADNLRAGILYKTVSIQPASRPGFSFKATEIRQAGEPPKKHLVMSAQQDWYTLFQVRPGRTNEPGTVSLQSIGMSSPGENGARTPRENPRCLQNSVRDLEHYLAVDNKSTRGGRFLDVRKAENTATFNQEATFSIEILNKNLGHIALKSVIPGRGWPFVISNQNNHIFMHSQPSAFRMLNTPNPFAGYCGQ